MIQYAALPMEAHNRHGILDASPSRGMTT